MARAAPSILRRWGNRRRSGCDRRHRAL